MWNIKEEESIQENQMFWEETNTQSGTHGEKVTQVMRCLVLVVFLILCASILYF
jgi:hypothetical protein